MKRNPEFVGGSPEKQSAFAKDLRALINQHFLENDSNTPDLVLSAYLLACLKAFNCSVNSRTELAKMPITNSSVADDYSVDD